MNRVRKGSGWEHLLEIARIEGLDKAYTWNPAIGCNNLDCEVRKRGKCWAMMLAKRFGWSFEPHMIPGRLSEPVKLHCPAVITPVSMGDLFGLEPLDTWKILWVCESCIWHKFAILTKLPQNAKEYSFNKNFWFGVTVNSQKDVWRLDLLQEIDCKKKYVLFEPLYEPIDYPLDWLDLIVIGPQNYPTVQPKPEWIESIIHNAKGAPVYFKSKLRR